MSGYYLYSKLLRSGVSRHIGTGGIQTVEWLEKHGIPYWDLCFMAKKSSVEADAYVEDSPASIEAIRKAKRQVMVLRNSTNQHAPGPAAESWVEVESREVGAWSSAGTCSREPHEGEGTHGVIYMMFTTVNESLRKVERTFATSGQVSRRRVIPGSSGRS